MSLANAVRIAAMVRSDPAGGIHQDDLAARLGLKRWAEMRGGLFLAYRKRWIDFCGPYIVHVPAAMRGPFVPRERRSGPAVRARSRQAGTPTSER
jgi:hypothetical protein